MKRSFNLRDICHVNTNECGDRFVGVKIDSSKCAVHFPLGYALSESPEEIRRDIKNLLQVLAIFTDKTERVMHQDDYHEARSVPFPIQAYLNIIDYYLDHNGSYYTEREPFYTTKKNGKISWSKTIKTQRPHVQGQSVLYLTPVVRIAEQDDTRLITRINRFCVYESFERIGWLFTTNKPESPDIQFDKTLFLAALYDKLSSTNNDNDKKLFTSMIAMINFIDEKTTNRQIYYGTDRFEIVWERLIDKFFGVHNKNDYFPHAIWRERYGNATDKPVSALEPDSIMIYNDKYYVIDAKYYRYGVYPEMGVTALPQSSDINKQITYGQFVKRNKAPEGAEVFNAFLIPFNMENNSFNIEWNMGNVAEAVGDWIQNPETYERVQGIVVDTRYLLKNFDGGHEIDKNNLSRAIENK